jgi:rfaE bifunctional protein kinase chain/domain
MSKYKSIINNFSKKRILVVGDLILDHYIRGSVSRISPEAPVPIVLQKETFYKPGGSANVANNLSSLHAKVTLVGRVGSDLEGKLLIKELKAQKIDTKGIFADRKTPTILKTRVLAHHQQIVRIDREENKDTDPKTNEEILNFILKNLKNFDAVILSDYGKGVITSELVTKVCSRALQEKVILTVDPKVEHFGYYRRVTGITPNLKETENAIRNIKITSHTGRNLGVHFDKLELDKDINLAGQELLKYLELQSLLITMGEHGMRLFEKGKEPVSIKTKAQEVYDVTGAGDTVISIYTLALAAGASKFQAADIANSAAGIVVGKLGAATVSKEELLAAT